MKISNTYINGVFCDEETGKNFELINPATESNYASLICSNEEQVNNAISIALSNEDVAAGLKVVERIEILNQILNGLNDRSLELANAITLEMGAPIKLTTSAHIQMGADHLQNTIKTLQDYSFEEDLDEYQLVKVPIGLVALITPWNWPLNQTLTKISSAIAAGCPIVMKPSEYSALSSRILIEIIDKSSLPKGCFNCVNGIGSEIGPLISSHPDIKMISFTGSTLAGVNIQELAATSVKRVSLELGGKSAHIICSGVDLEIAIPNAIDQCFINSGQSCSAPTRLLILKEDINEVRRISSEYATSIITGNPKNESTNLGPVINFKQYESIQKYIKSGIEDGYEIITGGLGKPDNCINGYYIKPTIFLNVDNSSLIAQEEIFGPVLSIISYLDIDDAVKIANDSIYGLSSYITCLDDGEGKIIAKRLKAGQTIVNKKGRGSAPAPFGGFKKSGNGREHGQFGLEEYLEVKAVI
jgi:aldehyde dehydrogenase (NAD+)